MIKNIQNIIKAYGSQKINKKQSPPEQSKAEGKKDELVLSSKGIAFQKALKAAKEASVTDPARVDEIKKQIQEGTYGVEPDKVTDKILEHGKIFGKLRGD